MPDSAECATTGRNPSASRSRNTAATLFQLLTEDTLVPPNFSTTHGDVLGDVLGDVPGEGLEKVLAEAPSLESAIVISNPMNCQIQTGQPPP